MGSARRQVPTARRTLRRGTVTRTLRRGTVTVLAVASMLVGVAGSAGADPGTDTPAGAAAAAAAWDAGAWTPDAEPLTAGTPEPVVILPPGPPGRAPAPGVLTGTGGGVGGGPPTVTSADIHFQDRTLREGAAAEVGLRQQDIDAMRIDAGSYLVPTADHPDHPAYAGAVVLAAKDGVIVAHDAVGMAVRYTATGPAPGRNGTQLPAAQQIPARPDTMFDLASMSKLFTAVVIMQLVETGRVELDAPVARYVPEFATGGKSTVTVRNLLTHTSGLPPWVPLYSRYPTPAARLAAALATPLAAGSVPGGQYVYSDIGLIALGVVVERVTGVSLDRAVRDRITTPLRMRDTMYNPPAALRDRIAATEDETYAGRGLVWGQVHDENAWSLGGVAGNAGVFSTAADLAVFAQMLLNGGVYAGTRILGADTVRSMLVDNNADLTVEDPESARGLGFELDKHWYMGPLSSPVTFGHTGFTGTSVVIDPLSHSFVLLLSNRVHPDRNWGGNNVARRAVVRDFGAALPVRPVFGATAWRAGPADGVEVTLTAPLRRGSRGATASFLLWYDTEPDVDTVSFEASPDGVTFTPVPVSLWSPRYHWRSAGTVTGYGGRQWWYVTATIPDGSTALRWTYRTDPAAQGRGVYVDGVLAVGPDGVLFAGEGRDATSFRADGWQTADH